MNKIIDEYEIEDLQVKSAALYFHGGMQASRGASQTAQRNGFNLEKHCSTKIDSDLFNWADTVFAMTYDHVAHLETFYNGSCKDKVELLGRYCSNYSPNDPSSSPEVLDPSGSAVVSYPESFAQIKDSLDNWLKENKYI